MTETPIAAIVLAAGKGTRMKSAMPKVLHSVAGRPMLGHVLAAVGALQPARVAVVVGPDMEDVAKAADPWPTVLQPRQDGTGDAVKAALPVLAGFDGPVLVAYGDTPLLTTETLQAMAARLAEPDAPALVVLGMRPDDPGQYGRLVTDGAGGLQAIVEYADATPAQCAIGLCNGGVMAFDGRRLAGLIGAIGNDNAKGEYYLTDAVAIARTAGHGCAVVEGSTEEVLGINSRADLAAAERVMQERLRARAMAGGATLVDPATVYFAADTVLGRDVTVAPHVVFGPGVRVADNVEILAFSHLEGVRIARGARIGPFARLRPGADIGPDAHIGNFVEVKNATLGPGAKANHLTYLGDADIGAGSNIGAGTITCNYDGFFKHRTEIGRDVFIGSNTALVAPVKVGDGANVGAGSVISRDVAADALAMERAQQVEKLGWAKKFRALMKARKAAKSGS
ncbi:MAG: bifunctional UDP-N-acetylglucosamine diphosphorylase/glucosamine-1-phosphate N-acetyltransferase GlmU [Alphaproteobacteria bacterium]|jgi:bifunctional UDP-N-acetylglucosamine pyrophosphorylase/glucosamine-1-phosphate N-acetyltransferase|nr:bifunctional UDP-N-acetylglucosamine diphosphorylase/glucosamine-1-phosphate N-acetyltransferase GlmU [Alphaproteobacteria bacterium]